MAVVPDYSAALVFEGNSATIKYFTRHSKLPA
jgi:hypothetical protein